MGKLFDRFCRVVERSPEMPAELREALERARVFEFNLVPHVDLPKQYSQEDVDWLKENFLLVFPCIALEDKTSCILMWDRKEGEPAILGINREIHVAEYIDFRERSAEFYDSVNREEDVISGLQTITMGNLFVQDVRTDQYISTGEIKFAAGIYRDEVRIVERHELGELVKPMAKNAVSSIQEAILLCDPSTFILESTPKSAIEKKPVKLKPGQVRRIPRSNERSVYTTLQPKEIRERMKLPATHTGRSVRPHERRAHFRTLRSEFFKAARGKQVFVNASWVGPSENVVGNRRYRVLLDI